MKRNLAFVLAFLIFSCHGNSLNDKVNVNNLKKFFSTSILNDSTIVIDSFKLAEIDTLSAKNGYIFMFNSISNLLDNNNDKTKKLSADIKYNLSNYKLMSDNPYAGSLLSLYRDNYNKDLAELTELVHKDSLYMIDINKLDTIMQKCDSITPIAYIAKCAYQIKNKDFTVERDTVRIRLNKDFNIITQNEYLKLLPPYNPVSEVSFK
jgi:hypothetical protein